MRTPFTHRDIVLIGDALRARLPMRSICVMLHPHTRDELVEAIDAIRRTDTANDALRHVNHVLALQAAGAPLINGKEAWKVAKNWGRVSYAPMF